MRTCKWKKIFFSVLVKSSVAEGFKERSMTNPSCLIILISTRIMSLIFINKLKGDLRFVEVNNLINVCIR